MVGVLSLLFSPFIDKDGFIKLPKNKKFQFIILLIIMFAVMLTAFLYEAIISYLYKIPTLLIGR